jgi:CheY-like chemotaxis protein
MIHVLVVEDDVALGTILHDKLAKEGLSVYLDKDGQEALDIVKVESFDLILLDLVMPGKNGFDFLDEYLATNKNPVPIIVLTNLADFSSKLKAYEKGISAYLVKADTPLDTLVKKITETANSKHKF